MDDMTLDYWLSPNLITIITVTNNDSWLKDYIVKSAYSKSKYLHIIKLFSSTPGERIEYHDKSNLMVISSPDGGIYDALNQALFFVKTPYYLVLGDDDELDILNFSDLLYKYSPILTLLNPSVIKFKAFNRYNNKISSYHSVSHILRVKLHSKYGNYSTWFKIASDQIFLNKLRHENIFESSDVIGVYGGAGISSKGWRLHFEHRLSQFLKLF